MKSVYVIDDHRLFSNGLELLLRLERPDLNCRVFDNAADGLLAMTSSSATPNLVIVDFYIPGANAPDLIRTIRKQWGECRIMVISASIVQSDKHHALEAGAELFVNKSIDPVRLLEIVDQLLMGAVVSAPTEDAAGLSARFNLTPRQLEILSLVSKGCTNKEIARVLKLSPETVKSHLSEIFQRFEVDNRVEAIDFAHSNGLA